MQTTKRIFQLLLLFCFSTASAQEETNPNRVLYKTNKVKSVKVYEYRYRKGEIRGNGKLLFDDTYDTAGFLTVSDAYIPRKFHQEYVYNEHGDLADNICDIFGPFHTPYSYKYDEKGRMIEKQERADGSKWYFTYDTTGNKIKVKWMYLGALSPGQYFVDSYEYNDQQQLTKMTRRRAGNDIYFYNLYTYDAAGNKVEDVRIENNDTTDIFIYHYDANNRCIADETTDKLQKKISCWSKTNYNDKGLAIDETGLLSYEDKPYYRKYVYEYY